MASEGSSSARSGSNVFESARRQTRSSPPDCAETQATAASASTEVREPIPMYCSRTPRNADLLPPQKETARVQGSTVTLKLADNFAVQRAYFPTTASVRRPPKSEE